MLQLLPHGQVLLPQRLLGCQHPLPLHAQRSGQSRASRAERPAHQPVVSVENLHTIASALLIARLSLCVPLFEHYSLAALLQVRLCFIEVLQLLPRPAQLLLQLVLRERS